MTTNHKQLALNGLVNASGTPSDIALVVVADAQVHATLYLAEQQRVANILTWYNGLHNLPTPVRDEIREILGLAP